MNTLPGIYTKINFAGIDSVEQEIIRKLGRVWYVTFASSTVYKGSKYTTAFVKPTDRLAGDFFLGREIIVVFSPYSSFEPRAIDFADKTILDYQTRLDKLCVILISQDPEIRSKVRLMTLQDKESRVLIPYSYNEFANAVQIVQIERLVISRLKQFLYERDLFDVSSALRSDTYFFGRIYTVQSLYKKYQAGENACLFGLRKIGKTSSLFAVKRYLELRDEPAVFLDCAEPSFHTRRWHHALHFIVANASDMLQLEGKVVLNAESSYDEINASRCFETDLKEISNQVGNKRILLIFDEIENLTFGTSPSGHWNTDNDYVYFWQSIRAVFQKNPYLFSFIIAGVNPKAVEEPIVCGVDNPIYRLIAPHYLSLFDSQEVREMVSSIGNYMGLHFEDEVFTYLTDDYGGHPFLIRQICSRIHSMLQQKQLRPFTVTKFWYQSNRDDLSRKVQDYVELIVSVLFEKYRMEYELLEHLAFGNDDIFNDYVAMSYSLIEHLEGYGLIKHDSGRYYFRIKIVREYIRDRSAADKAIHSLDDKRRAITTYRNKFESDFRRALKIALRFQYGSAAAGRGVFLDVIGPKERKDRLSALSLDEIFSSEVYLEDLRKVVISNWDDLGKLFNNDREHFKTYMEYVNKQRADAHPNEISDEEFSLVLIALKWLQKQIDNFLS